MNKRKRVNIKTKGHLLQKSDFGLVLRMREFYCDENEGAGRWMWGKLHEQGG